MKLIHIKTHKMSNSNEGKTRVLIDMTFTCITLKTQELSKWCSFVDEVKQVKDVMIKKIDKLENHQEHRITAMLCLASTLLNSIVKLLDNYKINMGSGCVVVHGQETLHGMLNTMYRTFTWDEETNRCGSIM